MRIDDIDQAGSSCAETGGLKINSFAGQWLDCPARPHPLIMVHGVIGKPCFEFRGEFATRGFALRADLANFRQAGGERSVLALSGEERQADRHPGRYIITKPRISVLIRSLDSEIRLSVGLGKSNIGCGLADARFDGSKQRIGSNRRPETRPIDRKVWDPAGDRRISVTRPTREIRARSPDSGDELIVPVVKLS